ncbi:MAG TPA: RHS repeat-associated core domain-containing protein [Myxococcota bacterium]|nr:RHS repeat-associated core domain-containing protein [Myxococcota bacterium]
MTGGAWKVCVLLAGTVFIIQAGCGGGDSRPPNWPASSALTATDISASGLRLTWTAAEDNTGVTAYRVFQDGAALQDVAADLRELAITGLAPETEYAFQLQAGDAAGNWSVDGPSTTATTAMDLPPDPKTVAPALDRSRVTDFYGAVSFLFSGDDSIQRGVGEDAIEPRRVAVLRGRVLDEDGSPLAGTSIDILDHPEFGWTESRLDGAYDLAVNGGSYLTLRVRAQGYLPVQRRVRVPYRDYVWLPGVVLVVPDGRMTSITPGASGLQAARGTASRDSDGARQATLLFPGGVGAKLVHADGSETELSSMSFRATELTVGEDGPARMPGQLPYASGYTYAVNLGLDEAQQDGVEQVEFDGQVYFYVDNFLGFPVGSAVPTGHFDEQRGVWVPSDSGRVIGIVSKDGGMAAVDINGDGAADTGSALSELGIDDAERTKLAELYAPGTSLWRVGVRHFSAWDLNWGISPPSDAEAPANAPKQGGDDGCQQSGSVIGCSRQVLGQDIDVAGLPYGMSYRSDRVPGRKTDYSVKIPLRGPEVPGSMRGIRLRIEVAGQKEELKFDKDPDPETDWDYYTYTWNGLDAYDRQLQGSVPINIAIGYVYRGVYQATDQFGYNGNGVEITGDWSRGEVVLWLNWQGWVGTWDARPQGMGGWSLGVHHVYDPNKRVLYLGNGRRVRSAGMPLVISTAAGNGENSGTEPAEGRLAVDVALEFVNGMALSVDPEGRLTFVDGGYLWRVERSGRLHLVAGGGQNTDYRRGVPAAEAALDAISDISFGPDGSIYLAQYATDQILRIGTDGILRLFAGTSETGYGGDGGPAVDAKLDWPISVAAAPDGNVYIADTDNCVVRRVSSDGVISTFAGRAGQCSLDAEGDGGPARDALLSTFEGVAVGPDGSVYIADTDANRVRRVTPDGVIRTVAGNGNEGDPDNLGDGGPAIEAEVGDPVGVAVGPQGELYMTSWEWDSRVRIVGNDGIIRTLAGGSMDNPLGDGGPAWRASFCDAGGVATGPEGEIYVLDGGNNRIRKINSVLPGYSQAGDVVIPASGGSELYVFDSGGRHLRTVSALSGAVLYEFAYDESGRLTTITDVDGNLTTIEHDSAGKPVAIHPPFAQPTALAVNESGYLDNITDAAGNAYRFSYGPAGLMQTLTDPNGNQHGFEYDGLGRLTKDSDPAGGYKTLQRNEEGIEGGHEVTVTTAMGRATLYRKQLLSSGDREDLVRFPDGHANRKVENPDGTARLVYTEGSSIDVKSEPDPRLGLAAPYLSQATFTTPDYAHQMQMSGERDATLEDESDPLSVTSLTETMDINGRQYEKYYNAAERLQTVVTPEGRESLTWFDEHEKVIKYQSRGLAPVELGYDEHGRLQSVVEGEGSSSRVYQLSYTPDGFLESMTDPLQRSVSFAHDAAGRVTIQTLPDGREILFGHDANGNLTSITPPGRPQHDFDYTPIDEQSDYTPPPVAGSGDTATHYDYNLDGQLKLVTRPDGQTIDIEYDTSGRASSVTIPRGVYTFDYEPNTGQLSSITAPDGGKLSYSWNGPLLTGQEWTGDMAGLITRDYDDDLRLVKLWVEGVSSIYYSYDGDGLLTGAGNMTIERDAESGLVTGTNLSSTTTASAYNAFGELSDYTASHIDTPVFEQNFERDALGRIVKKTETLSGQTTEYDYIYDPAGRLHEVDSGGVAISIYDYDQNSNRVSHTDENSDIVTGTYDDQDRLLSYGDATYSYTPNGELMSKTENGQTTTYSYDVQGNLTDVSLATGTEIHYIIDGRNRRIGKETNGVRVQGFLYQDQLNPVAELDINGQAVSQFIYASRVNVPDYMLSKKADGSTWVAYRIISDHLGSPRLVLDAASGQVIQQLDYDEFGRVLNDTNPGFQPFGFAGGLYEQSTGLIRFGARDYDAERGRWTAKDPAVFYAREINLYGYVANNPLNFHDAAGLMTDYNLTNGNNNPFFNFTYPSYGSGISFGDCMNNCMGALNPWLAGSLGGVIGALCARYTGNSVFSSASGLMAAWNIGTTIGCSVTCAFAPAIWK